MRGDTIICQMTIHTFGWMLMNGKHNLAEVSFLIPHQRGKNKETSA